MYSFENGIEISLSSYLESELDKKKSVFAWSKEV